MYLCRLQLYELNQIYVEGRGNILLQQTLTDLVYARLIAHEKA
jgi:hypothetical protein